jgi:hypothetical protein
MMNDEMLLLLLVVLSLVAVGLRVLLAKKQGKPVSVFWTVQELVFPVLLLAALVLLKTGQDVVFELIMLGLVEELVFSFLRLRARKKETQ